MAKIKLEITEAQLLAIVGMTDTLSAMIGTDEDFNKEALKQIRLIDKMLLKNGYKRTYN